MKLKFKHQQFQTEAVAAVVDLFKGRAAYRVSIDEEMLQTRCIAELANMERVQKAGAVAVLGRYAD